MLLFIINSWNVILPQYGISPGNNIFFNKNLKFIANALNNKIQPTDLIIGCAKDPKADMNQYLEITTLAFYNHHLNTAFLSPGYFVWQPSIETVIKKNAHNKIIYLCNTPTLPRNIGLQCSMPQSITAIQEPHHEHLISTYYVSTCHATISPINIS
jgi:hypothetical protein